MIMQSRSCLPLLDSDAALLVGATDTPPGAGRPLKDEFEPRPGGGPDPPRPKPELALALGSVDDCPGLLPGWLGCPAGGTYGVVFEACS